MYANSNNSYLVSIAAATPVGCVCCDDDMPVVLALTANV